MDGKSIPSESELNQLLKRTFTSDVRPDYVTVEGFTLPERYKEFEKRLKEFEVFDTDVWITGFPKTGTTWLAEIAWLILHDLDYAGAKEVDYVRTKQLEFSMLFNSEKKLQFGGLDTEVDSIGAARDQEHPRSIKAHLPFTLLPEQIINGTRRPKIIYVARNPMDTCVSYYHHCKNVEPFSGTFEEFCKLFLFDKTSLGPYPKHVLSFWQERNRSNMLFLTYEEMKMDLSGIIQKIAKFLGKTLTEEQRRKLEEYVSFDSMKKNPAVNKEEIFKFINANGGSVTTDFIRVGKAGGYKNTMSPELIAQFRYRMEKWFEGSGLNLLLE